MQQLGRYQVATVRTGSFAVDGGALFGVVPRPLWGAQVAADAQNRVRLATRSVVAVDAAAGRRILVDDGLGDKWNARRAARWCVEGAALDEALGPLGIARGDVTDVVLTHLHFDHAGGTTRRGAGGRLELAFPNATYHVQRRAWQWAHGPSEKDAPAFFAEDFELLQHSNRLHLVEGETELFPEFELIVSEGHTVAQQLPRIHGGGTHVTFCGDVIPTRAHLKARWAMAYDLYPLTTLEEKRMLLAQALEDDGILVFGHDLEVAACRLGERDGQPVFREAIDI